MLTKGETFNQRKRQLLDMIKSCRQMIRVVNGTIKKYPTLKAEGLALIEDENAIIKSTMQELIALQRWQKERVQREKTKRLPGQATSGTGR